MIFKALFPELADYDYFLDKAIDLTYVSVLSAMPSTIRNQLKGTVKSIVSDKILSYASQANFAAAVEPTNAWWSFDLVP